MRFMKTVPEFVGGKGSGDWTAQSQTTVSKVYNERIVLYQGVRHDNDISNPI
jgi:hypothetical protein